MIIQPVLFVSSAISGSVSPELISELDSRIRLDLQRIDDRLFFWVAGSAIIVAIGCLMEGPEIFHDLWPKTFACFAGRWVRKIGLVGWLLVVLGVAAEGVLEIYDHDASSLLQTFDEVLVMDAQRNAGDAQLSASAASDAAKTARTQSDAATISATAARQEADALTREITAAKQQSADASAKAADAVSRLADADNRLADATQRATAAEAELERMKTPRSLNRTPALVDSLRAFSGTKYVFQSVFQNTDSTNLMQSIDDLLQATGWIRDTSVAGFPALDMKTDGKVTMTVPVGLNEGILISVESTEELGTLQSRPAPDLPEHLKAAILLRSSLASSITPAANGNVEQSIHLDKGASTTVRIAVGSKPLQ